MKYNLKRGQRLLCAQLHSGRLPLALETGSFNDTPEEDRLCLLSDTGDIENEFPLLCCPVFVAQCSSSLGKKAESVVSEQAIK